MGSKDAHKAKDLERTYITSTIDDKTMQNADSEYAQNKSMLSNIFSVRNLSIQPSIIEERTEKTMPYLPKQKSFKVSK